VDRYLEGSYHGSRLNENSCAGPSNASEAHNKEPDGEVTTLTRKKSIAHDAPEFDSPTVKKKKTSEAEAEAAVQLTASIEVSVTRCVETGSLPRGLDLPQITVQKVTQKTRDKVKVIEGQLDYTSSIAFAIAAAIKRSNSTTEVVEEPGNEVKRLQHLSSKQELSSSLVAEILVSQLRETDSLRGYIPQACKGHLNFLTVGCRVESDSPSSGKVALVTSPITEGDLSAGYGFCIVL
jgi:arginine-tRNA-protein transferase